MADSPGPRVADVLEEVAALAQVLGVETYLVGGYVRDLLRGVIDPEGMRGEGRDVDLLTVGGGGDELMVRLARRMGWPRPQHFERFGTAQLRGDGMVVEMVRARAERYDPASRRPDVRPGTLDEDVWRRDFTVNTLVQTLDGRVLDRTGRGIADLVAGVLRTPLEPRETFSEDPLRMYRAARFAAQLGFQPAAGMLEAMREQAHRADILGAGHVLSVERVTDELRKLLAAPHPRAGMEVMRAGGLLEVALPEVAAMVGVEQSGYHVHDVFEHTVRALDASPRDLLTRLGVLFHDIGKPPCHAVTDDGRHTFHDHPEVGAVIAERVMTALRFSTDEVRSTSALVRLHLRPIQYDAATFSDAAVRRLIRDAGPLRGRMLDVARADTRASAFPGIEAIDELERRMERLDRGGAVSRLRSPLDGDEIRELAEGRAPGPWLGRAKRALEDAVIEGAVPDGDAGAARRWLTDHPHLLTAP